MIELPTLSELMATLHVVSLPMRVRFRGITVREAALFEGPFGWTEFSPFLEYDDREAAAWLAAAIEYGWRPLPEARRTTIPVNATMPAVAPNEVPGVLTLFGSRAGQSRAGQAQAGQLQTARSEARADASAPDIAADHDHALLTVKVKVAEDPDDLAADVARVRAVRAATQPGTHIRVDANGRWTLEQAKRALDALAEFELEYAEQPVATLDDLAAVRAWSHETGPGTRIAADESIRKADDPLRVANAGAADVIVVKVQPLGGVERALGIVARSGLPAVVSSALDTAVGISAGAALAALLPELPFACGLGTGGFFTADVVARPADWSPLRLTAERVRPDAGLLDAARASAECEVWWRERIERCYAVLAGGVAA